MKSTTNRLQLFTAGTQSKEEGILPEGNRDNVTEEAALESGLEGRGRLCELGLRKKGTPGRGHSTSKGLEVAHCKGSGKRSTILGCVEPSFMEGCRRRCGWKGRVSHSLSS